MNKKGEIKGIKGETEGTQKECKGRCAMADRANGGSWFLCLLGLDEEACQGVKKQCRQDNRRVSGRFALCKHPTLGRDEGPSNSPRATGELRRWEHPLLGCRLEAGVFTSLLLFFSSLYRGLGDFSGKRGVVP